MRNNLRRILYLLFVFGLMIGMLQPMSSAAQPVEADEVPQSPVEQAAGGEGAMPDPMSKLDSELRTLAAEGGEAEVEVYILAKEGADLSSVVSVTETRPFPDGAELVVATVKPTMIAKMASHPDVVAAEVFLAIEAPIPLTPKEDIERLNMETVAELRAQVAEIKANPELAEDRPFPAGAAPSSGYSPDAVSDWNGAGLIGAPEAWAKGYTGDGVNIAIIDSGVDFGHPDLENNIAFYENGDYEDWPIALDPYSMRNYYYNGYTSWDNYWDGSNLSWYAGVWDVIFCTQGMTETFELDGFVYSISPDLVDMSLSGEIRWGVHPDFQLPAYVSPFGEWMPFIMLDTQVAGVYDTVIADLNYDRWFDMYDDTAVLGSADPVLNQDLGSYVYTDTLVMTGTHYVPAGLWWVPPLWWGYIEAGTAITLTAGSYIYALDHNTPLGATDGSDGIEEVSGGMVYYIADGELPVPGMDYLYPGSGTPPNGQLVAFMLGSDWAGGGDHGTKCASAAVAGGEIKGYFAMFGEFVQYDPEDWSNFFNADDISQYLPWLKAADEGTVQGPAPGAMVIAIGDNYAVVNGMQGFYDSYTFLAYGVDGEPNTGDEFVDIASMSYGAGSVHSDGWDWESRLISYYNQHFLPNTTFFASSGNGGPGFGTVNSPQGNTVVTVGASTQYGASTVFGSGISADQINDGEIVHFSGRGPDAMGRPDPDVVATGGWGAGNSALNMNAIYNLSFSGFFPGDGNNAWYEWGGTSRSAPEAAGVMATIYDAYMQANGTKPDFETARQILMSGAQDLEHDVLRQGAGRVNADTGTDIAAGLGGVYVSPSLLSAGEYMGTHYESFGNMLFPGDEWTQTFTVHNPSAAAATVDLGDEMLMEMGTLNFTQVVSPYLGAEGPYPDTFYYWADYFVGGDPMTTTHGADLAVPVPAGADFMEVELTVPFEIFDFCYNDPDPNSICYTSSPQRWSLTVYDWTDRNGDGVLWEDWDSNGVVSGYGEPLQVSATGWVTETELSRFTYAYNYANVQGATVRLGERDDIDNIVIGLVHRYPNDTRPGWGPDEYQDSPLMVKVVFYEKVDWPIVETSAASLTVPAGSSTTFDATFTIPDDPSLYGVHEGAITVGDAVIPTTVNVAVPSDELLFNLGGSADAGTPYDNSRMGPGYTWSGVREEGDWRFYYYDANTGFDQQYLYVQNQWGDVCGNMPTFNETLVWGPNIGDQFSMLEPEKYGPYSMQFAGGTPYANTGGPFGWGAPRAWAGWYDGDGIAQPESRAWATLWDGLNQVQFRNVLMSGKVSCGEGFAATAGVFGVDAPYEGTVINTTEASGSFQLDVVSPVDGLWAYTYGFGEETFMNNQDVPQGKHPDEWPPPDLMDGWVYTFEASNLDGMEIQTQGPWSSDIDLFLLFDANGDGLFNFYDNREWIASSADWGPWEYIEYWGNFSSGGMVADGTYAVVMYGFHVADGDQFDIAIRTYGGDNLSIAEAMDNMVATNAGEPASLTVDWNVDGPGIHYGWMWFGMPHDDWPDGGMGPWIGVPVVINKEGAMLEVSKDVSHMMADFGETITYTVSLDYSGAEEVWVEVTDMLPEGLDFVSGSITSTLQADYPDFFGYMCETWFDEYMRTVHFNCPLPFEAGDAVTSFDIMFKARVAAQPGTEFLNKADARWYHYWYGEDLIYGGMVSDTAYTVVPLKHWLPIINK